MTCVNSSTRLHSPILITEYLFFLLFSIISPCVLAQEVHEAEGPRLICPDVNVTGEYLKVDCKLQNHGMHNIFVVPGHMALEGPTENALDYIYLYVAGRRYENILHYNRSDIDLDGLPIQFKPTVHLTLEEVDRLRRVPRATDLAVRISWHLGSDIQFLSKHRWTFQVKLIYVFDESLSRLLEGQSIIDECKRRIAIARKRAADNAPMELVAQRLPPAMRRFYDGCRDVISEEFKHIFSNTLDVSFP